MPVNDGRLEILHLRRCRRHQSGVANRACRCLLIAWAIPLLALSQTTGPPPNTSGGGQLPKGVKAIFDYLTMAGTATSADFKPQSQGQRNHDFARSLINPVWYMKGAFSAALDQRNDKPKEWEQGGSGYGKRFGNIMGQYAIHRTAMFGTSSLLHEDNRYFGSGKKGFWRRTGYALSSGILARHDNGKRYPSVSLIGGFASGAFISRAWLPPSTNSAGDGAVSFGKSMGYNFLGCVIKEFLPDVVRPIVKRRK